jgi:hypothetical protein
LPDDVVVRSSTSIFPIAFGTPSGSPSLTSVRASTAELRPRTATPAGSPARPTYCIAIACGRSPTQSSSVPAPCGPTIRS